MYELDSMIDTMHENEDVLWNELPKTANATTKDSGVTGVNGRSAQQILKRPSNKGAVASNVALKLCF